VDLGISPSDVARGLNSVGAIPIFVKAATNLLGVLADACSDFAKEIKQAGPGPKNETRATSAAENSGTGNRMETRDGGTRRARPDEIYDKHHNDKPGGKSGSDGTSGSGGTTASDAGNLEQHADRLVRSMRDLLEQTTYPNFNEFLKEMVEISQKLREASSAAKMAAVQGKFDQLMAAADKMLEAAEQAKQSRDKQLKAEQTQAIFQIVAGCLTIGLTLYSFKVGYSKQTAANKEATALAAAEGKSVGQLPSAFGKGLDATQSFAPAIQGIANILNSSATLITYEGKKDASKDQYDADKANAKKAELEAAATLMDQQIQIADDLRDIAKGVRDMALKLLQDLIAAQAHLMERVV
jgi:hypothetical protein